MRKAIRAAEDAGYIEKSYWEVKMMYEETDSSSQEAVKRDLITAVRNFKQELRLNGRINLHEIIAALHAACDAGYKGRVYNYAWKTYVEHETGFTDFTLKPLLKARVANISDTAANKLKAEPCPSKDFRLKERPDLAVNTAPPPATCTGKQLQ